MQEPEAGLAAWTDLPRPRAEAELDCALRYVLSSGLVRASARSLMARSAAEVGPRRGALRSFSETPLPNPAGAFRLTGLSSDYSVVDAVGPPWWMSA
jgi:hypothetical protein